MIIIQIVHPVKFVEIWTKFFQQSCLQTDTHTQTNAMHGAERLHVKSTYLPTVLLSLTEIRNFLPS